MMYEFFPRCRSECYDHGVYCSVCGLDLDRLVQGPPKTEQEIQEIHE